MAEGVALPPPSPLFPVDFCIIFTITAAKIKRIHIAGKFPGHRYLNFLVPTLRTLITMTFSRQIQTFPEQRLLTISSDFRAKTKQNFRQKQ